MDYEYPMYYGFSVNREITQNQLEAIQNTYYTLYPDTWSSITAGFTTQEEVESQTEELEPLHAETVSVIENMLGHIAGAGIPYSPLEYTMFKSMLEGVHNQEYHTRRSSPVDHRTIKGASMHTKHIKTIL